MTGSEVAIAPPDVDGVSVCRMFDGATAGQGRRRIYSSWISFSFATLAHCVISPARNDLNCAALLPTGSVPAALNFSTTLGALIAARAWLWSAIIRLRQRGLQRVLVMQPTQHRLHAYEHIRRQSMSGF